MTTESKPRHRHERNSWLICGGHIEWCYQCGAWRFLKKIDDVMHADGKWNRPSGIGGPNPAMKEQK